MFRSNKTRHFSFLECSDDDLCVDVTENGRMVKVSCNGTFEEIVPKKKFIKCCPLKHSYDPQLHTCVKDAREDDLLFPAANFYVEIGLGSCGFDSAIKDLVVNYDNINRTNDGSLYLKSNGLNFSKQNICIDRVSEQNYYMTRVCESLERVCRHDEEDVDKVRCLRKCCNDGEHFIERKCTRMFEKGINLTKYPFDNPNGK